MTRAALVSREVDLLTCACAAVRAVEPAARVILYGSRARGDAAPDSDWDLLVLLDGPAGDERKQRVYDRLLALSIEAGESLEALVYGSDEWESPRHRALQFHQNVMEEGAELTAGGRRPHHRTRVGRRAMAEAREQVVRDLMEQARESLAAGELLVREEFRNAAVSRLYYACFYAVSALLTRRGYKFSKHGSVHGLFNERFVHPGTVPPDLGKLYNELFKNRLVADYGSHRFTEAEVRPWLEQTPRFIAFIEGLLQSPMQDESHPLE